MWKFDPTFNWGHVVLLLGIAVSWTGTYFSIKFAITNLKEKIEEERQSREEEKRKEEKYKERLDSERRQESVDVKVALEKQAADRLIQLAQISKENTTHVTGIAEKIELRFAVQNKELASLVESLKDHIKDDRHRFETIERHIEENRKELSDQLRRLDEEFIEEVRMIRNSVLLQEHQLKGRH